MSKIRTEEEFNKAMERLNTVLLKAIDYINLYRKDTTPSEKLTNQYVDWILKDCCCPEDEIKYLVNEITSDERTHQEKVQELQSVMTSALNLEEEV